MKTSRTPYSRSACIALLMLLVAGWAAGAAAAAAPEPETARAVKDGDEENALSGVFEDCVMKFSFSCLQKKVLVFIERLGRRDMFGSWGGYLSVVRSAPVDASAGEALVSEKALDAVLPRSADARVEALESLMDDSVDRFFRDHVLRVNLPNWLSANTGEARSATNVIEIKLDDNAEERSSGERLLRKKKKKFLLGLLLLFKLKFVAMFFVALGLLGLKAITALVVAKAAFALSAFLLFRKLMSLRGTAVAHGHGHKHVSGPGYDYSGYSGGDSFSGGDSYGGGHSDHGWAARSQQETFDPQKLAYRAYAGNKVH